MSIKPPPIIPQKTNTTKDTIISTLSEHLTLTAKNIHQQTTKQTGKSISYQAIHKTLNELIQEGVIIKDTRGYSLNLEWVKKQKDVFDKIEKGAYSQEYYEKGNAKIYNFNSYKEGGRMMLQLLKNNCDLSLNEKFYVSVKHMWMALSFESDEYQWFLDLASKGGYLICNEDSALDRAITGLWIKAGIKIME